MLALPPPSLHVQHVQHWDHEARRLPVCREEDGSGQRVCRSGPGEALAYIARVTTPRDARGYVTREYVYRNGRTERIREKF